MVEYKNRYGDVYTFTKQEDGSVLWEGSFEHCRFGSSNDYSLAYQNYCKDSSSMGITPMHIEDFKEAIHEAVYDENDRYVGPSVIGKQYQKMVKRVFMKEKLQKKLQMIFSLMEVLLLQRI